MGKVCLERRGSLFFFLFERENRKISSLLYTNIQADVSTEFDALGYKERT